MKAGRPGGEVSCSFSSRSSFWVLLLFILLLLLLLILLLLLLPSRPSPGLGPGPSRKGFRRDVRVAFRWSYLGCGPSAAPRWLSATR
eukprot:9484807-Pyramimonas_sp.AAC.1